MGKLATRYAKSLLDFTLEKGLVEKVYADMKLVSSTCKENHELHVLLKSPIVDTHKKFSILSAIFSGKIESASLDFMKIVTYSGREMHLEAIAEAYQEQYKKHKKIITAVVTTANGLDEELRAKVQDVLKKSSGAEIELIEKQNPDLIGGFILRVGDKQDDSSIAKKLKSLYRTFNENPYVKEF